MKSKMAPHNGDTPLVQLCERYRSGADATLDYERFVQAALPAMLPIINKARARCNYVWADRSNEEIIKDMLGTVINNSHTKFSEIEMKMRNLPDGKQDNFPAYVSSILYHWMIDQERHSYRRPAASLDSMRTPDDTPIGDVLIAPPEPEAVSSRLADRLRLLQEANGRDLDRMIEQHLDGLSYSQMAERRGVPVGTVKSQQHTAKNHVVAAVRNMGDNGGEYTGADMHAALESLGLAINGSAATRLQQVEARRLLQEQKTRDR